MNDDSDIRLQTMQVEIDLLKRTVGQLQEENSTLLNICAASYRLHGATNRPAVIDVIEEVTMDLIGSEESIIFEAGPSQRVLRPVHVVGLDADRFGDVAFGEGLIGRTAADATLYFGGEEPPAERLEIERDLTACIPLRHEHHVVGAVALFRLFRQKQAGLTARDRELLGFLATHAGRALHATRDETDAA